MSHELPNCNIQLLSLMLRLEVNKWLLLTQVLRNSGPGLQNLEAVLKMLLFESVHLIF